MNHCSIPLLLILAATAPGAHASMEVFNADPDFPSVPPGEDAVPTGRWLGEVVVGFAANTGNTEATNLNAKLLLGYEVDDWRHTVNLSGHRASDAVGTTAERYVLTGKTDYKLSDVDYVFLTGQFERDRFAGIDRRTSEALGYGRELLATDQHKIPAEAGLGARQVSFVDGREENDAIVRLAGGWLWTISETSEFSQRLVIETGDTNTYSESTTALKTNLIGSIYSSLSFTVKHNTTVPAGLVSTDTFTALQLEYRF